MTFDEFRSCWFDADDCVMAHTSGSTGVPKPVRLKKSDMTTSALATCRRFNIRSGSVLAIPLSADYIAGKMMAVRSFVSGAQLVELHPSRRPLDGYTGRDIDLLAIVPSQIEGVLNASTTAAIHNIIIGGAPISADQERALIEAKVNAFATYGMTETCSHVALRRVGDPFYEAMPGITFDTAPDGCLIVNVPEMTIGQVVTRDVVELISPVKFRWLGRADNAINSGGVKLHPELIEKVLTPIMADRQFYITSRRSNTWGEEVVMILLDDHPVSPELRQRIAVALPKYSQPKDYINDPHPQYTSSGKLRRRKL
ncbi:MAG: AMP-binding protein [Lachnoclostridium sp.]|nr:AMP-binding protein [Lachnoclostridium sp.]